MIACCLGWKDPMSELITLDYDGAVAVMNSAQATLLDDSHPVFTFQASCFNSQPSQTNNLSYALLKNGAIGTIGATVISHGPGGPHPAITHPASAGGNAGMAY